MAEWFKAHAWKACKRETVSRVRIPLSPPFFNSLAQPTIYNKIVWASYGRQQMINKDIENRFKNRKIYHEKLCRRCNQVKHHMQFRLIKKTSTYKWNKLSGFRGSEKTLHYSLCKICEAQRMEENYKLNPIPQMLSNAKIRARQKGVTFSIKTKDIKAAWPKGNICPIFKINFEMGYSKDRARKKQKAHSPSLDRIDPKKGYVPGNIAVISDLANRIKQDATIDQIEAVYRFLKNNKVQKGS